MPDVVIKVENLGKKYQLKHQQNERYTALRDVLAAKFKSAVLKKGEKLRAPEYKANEDFWALKGLTFEIKQGEVVGIIGRNGAGKSTLLKILSRITEPSEGRARIRGRVASLLEVGTGFHPELTGRENIFLNGAVLGMATTEIRKKFDEIVAFADVEKFLDTPVKRYSSGMYVRLAFAVAAHLEPDILIIDEVLAVGDSEFQKKCLGKMKDVSSSGRTIFFVSHNLAAVQALCQKGLVLSKGVLTFDGDARTAIQRYQTGDDGEIEKGASRFLSATLSLVRLAAEPSTIRSHESITFNIELQSINDEIITDLALLIHSQNGERVALVDLRDSSGGYRLKAGNTLSIQSRILSVPFIESEYNVGLYVSADSVCQSFMDLYEFTVLPIELRDGIVPRDKQFRGLVELSTQFDSCIL